MSILGRLLRTDHGAEMRTLQSSYAVPPAPGREPYAFDYMGEDQALRNLTVFACVRLLSDTIASLPWKAYRRDSHGIPKELPSQPKILQQPYPTFDLFQYKWMMIASLALRGNFYAFIADRDNQGNPTSLFPVHPDAVRCETRPNDQLMWFDPEYSIRGERVPKEDMIHIRRFTNPGHPVGLSPIRQAAIAIGMSLASEAYGYNYFRDSANPSGTLSTDQEIDDGAVQRVQRNWIASHGGRRLPAVLTNGFKFETLSISPEESQFLETRQFQRSEICMMYGVPPILIGDTKETTAWGTGVEQITQGAVTYTFSAWTACIESEISSLLPRGQFVRFDYNALLRGDIERRFTAYKNGISGTWLTPNEVRAFEELTPVDGGDTLLQATNLTEFPPKPEPEPQPEPFAVNPAEEAPDAETEKPQVAPPPGEKPISGGEKTPTRNRRPAGTLAK